MLRGSIAAEATAALGHTSKGKSGGVNGRGYPSLAFRRHQRRASHGYPRPFTPPDLPFDVWPRAAVASAAIEPHSIVALAALAEAAISDDLDAVAVRECPLQRRVELRRGS